MNKKSDPAEIYKVVMFGASGVGKHSLFERFLYDKFRPIKNCIIGGDFGNKAIKINEKEIKVQVWTTSGNARYRQFVPAYSKGADGIILVYDIIEKFTFDEMKLWLKEVQKCVDKNVVISLVANKCDLESDRVISAEMGKKFAEENHFFSFTETSALNSTNVEKVFVDIFTKIDETKQRKL